MLYEYEINGSLVVYDDGEIFWDLEITIVLENRYELVNSFLNLGKKNIYTSF